MRGKSIRFTVPFFLLYALVFMLCHKTFVIYQKCFIVTVVRDMSNFALNIN
jgi:hypothetical protein